MALNNISFSQVFLATTIVILASHAKAQAALDSRFCAKTDAGEERALCNSLVKGAKTWDAALSNVIKVALEAVKPVKPLIDNLPKELPASLLSITKDSILQTCKDSYDGILDEFNGALENIKTGDKFKSINSQLSAALSSMSDCTDGLGEFGVNPGELTKFQDILEKYASLSLAVSSTKA